MTIQQDIAQTWHDAIIELFELDLEPITGSVVDKYYFTSSLMPDNTKISWKGKVYEPFPIDAVGFDRTTKGQLPTPELTVANVLGTLASVVNTFDDLVGAKVIRRRTLLKYLDGGTTPDSSQEFPDDVFYIERKIAENSITITWQLASKIDLEGLQLPKRVITQNYCLWKYRGSECGYTGPGVADQFDRPLKTEEGVSEEGQAYIDALAAFDAAKTDLEIKETSKNLALAKKEKACSVPVSAIGPAQFNLGSQGVSYSFVIQDGDGNTIASVWNGQSVVTTGEAPPYRASTKVRTSRGPGIEQNGTGEAYRVREFPADNVFQGRDLPFNSSNFSIRDTSGNPIIFVNGQLVQERASIFVPGYQQGSYASAGFAPMRSIEELDYTNSQCPASIVAYDNAQAAYDSALITYNNAVAALDAAYAALPDNDSTRRLDQCGKRLQSCRLRFGRRDLPFGGFPGAILTR